MTETSEIKKKKEKKTEQEEKPTLWQRIKKPVMTGVLAAGLLMSGAKRTEALPTTLREPPKYAAELIEKENKLAWKCLSKTFDETLDYDLTIVYIDMAIKEAKKTYDKNPTPENYYIYAYSVYVKSALELSIKSTEKRLREAFDLVEKRLKEQPNDVHFLDLALMIKRAEVQVYWSAYTEDPVYKLSKSITESKEYYANKMKETAKEYEELLKKAEEMQDKLDLFLWKSIFNEEKKKKAIDDAIKDWKERHEEIKKMISDIKE